MSKKLERNEFRKNKVSGHPAYIYAKIGNKFIYLGITHSAIDSKTGELNIKLDKNPNPFDSRNSYIKSKSEMLKENKFAKPYKNWKFSDSDIQKIEDIKKRRK